ncbi:hypothetical protein Cgig2_007434 [Carnegiea gigantea]|uniref:Serine protease EDA2 n=1 Tax=Carnegiea gigantea TaxID=171969 RepID=A0A9Q1QSG3_9CARY|nr:hypothetical protein Cgig2_007434 [Carnegiea gigantea]
MELGGRIWISSLSSNSIPSSFFFIFIFIIFFILGQFSSSSAHLNARLLRHNTGGDRFLTTQEQRFNQTIDHFSPYDHRQFEQRYYEFLGHFRSPNGPIFLRICGEESCDGIPNDYLSILAKKFGAAIVTLEHRYYGKSSPFKSHTTENLRYLSSKQALFDLAAFRQYYQDSLNLKLGRSNVENPWFIFGVSYAGALSAWFRLKFPHLTCGSLASSAVVLDVYNFTEFDEQLKIDGDFMYFLADAAAVAVGILSLSTTYFQYGTPDKLCSPLVEAKKASKDLVDAYASYVQDFYVGNFGVSVKSYDRDHLKKTASGEDSADRLWWFQVCSEVAYFQVAPENDSIRSSKIDTRYHLDLCKDIFGNGVYPDVAATNLYYGGTKISGSKIIFTNGSQDPWRRASKQTSSPGSEFLCSTDCLPISSLVIIVAMGLTCGVALNLLFALKVMTADAALPMLSTKCDNRSRSTSIYGWLSVKI